MLVEIININFPKKTFKFFFKRPKDIVLSCVVQDRFFSSFLLFCSLFFSFNINLFLNYLYKKRLRFFLLNQT